MRCRGTLGGAASLPPPAAAGDDGDAGGWEADVGDRGEGMREWWWWCDDAAGEAEMMGDRGEVRRVCWAAAGAGVGLVRVGERGEGMWERWAAGVLARGSAGPCCSCRFPARMGTSSCASLFSAPSDCEEARRDRRSTCRRASCLGEEAEEEWEGEGDGEVEEVSGLCSDGREYPRSRPSYDCAIREPLWLSGEAGAWRW